MAEIKVLKVVDGDYTENDSAADSIKVASLLTANNELTDAKLTDLIGAGDASTQHHHDGRYYQESEHINVSAGVADAAKPVILNAAGEIDPTMLPAASSGSHGDLTDLLVDDHTQYTLADGTRAFTGDQSLGTNKITNLAAGTAGTDAVNFDQLNAAFNDLDRKNSVQLVSTGNVALTGEQTIDGVLTSASRVLLIGQTDASENGIYDTAAGAWARSSDANTDAEVTSGLMTTTEEGSNAGQVYLLTTANPIVLDTTNLTFVKLSHALVTASLGVENVGGDFRLDILASGGLKLTGNEVGVEPADFSGEGLVDDGADNLAIDWSTAFNDSKAIKASDLGSTATGFGASLIGLENPSGFWDSSNVEDTFTELSTIIQKYLGGDTFGVAGVGGVTKGDLVYFSANDTVLPMPIGAKHVCVGIALDTVTVGQDVNILLTNKIVTGLVAGATFDTPYYWNGSALVTAVPSGSGSYVWRVGSATNATDIAINIEFIKKNAA